MNVILLEHYQGTLMIDTLDLRKATARLHEWDDMLGDLLGALRATRACVLPLATRGNIGLRER